MNVRQTEHGKCLVAVGLAAIRPLKLLVQLLVQVAVGLAAIRPLKLENLHEKFPDTYKVAVGLAAIRPLKQL